MSNCFLYGYGSCGGKISGEHYISEAVLEAISSTGKVQIGGLPWQQPKETLQSIGISSLVSNILCETHNSGLSALDTAAGAFFRAVDAADKRPATLPPVTIVDGVLIERWFLKILCGLAAGPRNAIVPQGWKRVLSGEPWPNRWGMYVPSPAESQVLATEFYLETLVNHETRTILAAKFRVAGVLFSLLLGRPDHAAAWGIHRPSGLIFRQGQIEKRIELDWPKKTDQAVVYTRVGSSKERPPQWEGWKE